LLNTLTAQFRKFSHVFRVLVAATFIDRLGGALIFPFLSLYIAERFQISMTEIGLLLGMWSVSSLVGSMIGGALADKLGRKVVLICGLLFSAGTALLMGFVNEVRYCYLIAAFSGLFSDLGHPAQQAMVADLLDGEQRAEGFSLLRVVANLAVTFGPMIGGLLADFSYLLLFIIDAIASTITAAIVFTAIPETKPVHELEHPSESILDTLVGYGRIFKDKLFIAFVFAMIIMLTVYTQMYGTLSVFLFRVHGVSARGFGYIMSMNAAMVVLFQFWVTRAIRPFPPMLMMVVASALYGVGFLMYGFVSEYWLFMLAMAIITIGEMVHVPVAQSLAAFLSPEDMRGRYMAFFGLAWMIPNSIASLLAGLVMDHSDPRMVWVWAGIFSLIAIVAFFLLYLKTRHWPGVGVPASAREVEISIE